MSLNLPMKSVVLFIAVGTLVFVIVFIFAKRQIARFALKGRGPHKPIGSDAPKKLRHEIERRLKRAADIQYEPLMLNEAVEARVAALPKGETLYFYYRMKAVDALKTLDKELLNYSCHIRRQYGSSLRAFLIEQRTGPLQSAKLDTVEKFCDMYDHARNDPTEFGKKEYLHYMGLLHELIQVVRDRIGGEKMEAADFTIPNGSSPQEEKMDTHLSYRPRTERDDAKPEAEASLLVLDRSSISSSLGDAAMQSGKCGIPL